VGGSHVAYQATTPWYLHALRLTTLAFHALPSILTFGRNSTGQNVQIAVPPSISGAQSHPRGSRRSNEIGCWATCLGLLSVYASPFARCRESPLPSNTTASGKAVGVPSNTAARAQRTAPTVAPIYLDSVHLLTPTSPLLWKLAREGQRPSEASLFAGRAVKQECWGIKENL
jgi:hypothetical protein